MAAAPLGLPVASSMFSPSRRTLRRRRLRRQRTTLTRDELLSYCPPRLVSRSKEQYQDTSSFTVPQLSFLRQLMEKSLTGFAQVLCDEIETFSRRVEETETSMQRMASLSESKTNDEAIAQLDECDVSVVGHFRALPLSSWKGIWEPFNSPNQVTEHSTATCGTTLGASVQDQIAFAQIIGTLVNSRDRGTMKIYHFEREPSLVTRGHITEPKMPPSAYMLFVQDRRAMVQGDMQFVAKTLQEDWKSSQAVEKAMYEARASHLRQQYENDLRLYMYGR